MVITYFLNKFKRLKYQQGSIFRLKIFGLSFLLIFVKKQKQKAKTIYIMLLSVLIAL